MTARESIQRFRIVDVLGDGGMGTVYRAHDPQLERDVAIKVLKATAPTARGELTTENTVDLRDRKGHKRRDDLLHEARMMARLSDPHVVPIFEVGLDDRGFVFVVMEYVVGPNIRAWLEQQPRSASEIRAAYAQAARGLHAAHERGVIHRDFKPDNVLIGADGRARVTDFGIAGLADANALVRTTKVAGTPRYMAPELWNGAPASAASDVYALCAAIQEAFGDEVPDARLRDVVRRGVAKEPAQRPSLGEVIVALEGRTARPRWVLPAAVGVLAAGAGVAFAVDSDDALSCEPVRVAGRWDDAKRAAVRASVPDAERLVTIFERREKAIEAQQRAVCEKANRGELTAAQRAAQLACLDRRMSELGGIVDAHLAAKTDVARAEIRFNRAQLPAACETATQTVSTTDPTVLDDLYARFAKSADINDHAEGLVVLEGIEREARAIGDVELAARVTINRGIRTRNTDKQSAADALFQQAFNEGTALGNSDIATSALVERISTLTNAENVTEAKSLTQIAMELAARPTTTTRTRLRLARAVGRNHGTRGDYKAAIEMLRTALVEAEQSDERNIDTELLVRNSLVEAMYLHGGKPRDEAMPIARETVELSRKFAGEKSWEYVYALDKVGTLHMLYNRHAESLAARRQILDLYLSMFSEGHSNVVEARVDVGISLMLNGDLEEAHRELSTAVALADKNEALERSKPWYRTRLATVMCDLGRMTECLKLYEQAIDQMTSGHGAHHPQVTGQRFSYADFLLEARRLDDAERVMDLLENSYQQKPEPQDKRPARLRGSLRAILALVRDRPQEAEDLARRALDELLELEADPGDIALVRRNLGEAILAQGRASEAHPLLAEAFEAAKLRNPRADYLAYFDAMVGHAELALGKRDEARARAERLAPIVERYRGARLAREKVAELLVKTK